jgi:hypothetical protein
MGRVSGGAAEQLAAVLPRPAPALLRDSDIRQALRARLAAAHDPADTLIIDELGVCQGAVRVDVAVVNGLLAGFEIKSERDTLDRLPAQAIAYSRVFDEVTAVASERHLAAITELVPEWWGLEVATLADGGVILQPVRHAARNAAVEPASVVKLLWREEALDELRARGLGRGVMSKPREFAWARLAKSVSCQELGEIVRSRLRSRQSWRPDR